MNFFPNQIPYMNNIIPNIDFNNNLLNKLTEFDNRIKVLEQKIAKLENELNNNNEQNNGFYML